MYCKLAAAKTSALVCRYFTTIISSVAIKGLVPIVMEVCSITRPVKFYLCHMSLGRENMLHLTFTLSSGTAVKRLYRVVPSSKGQ